VRRGLIQTKNVGIILLQDRSTCLD